MRTPIAIVAVLGMISSAAPAMADDRYIPKSVVLDKFAGCVAEQYEKETLAFMATEVGSKQEDKAGSKLFERAVHCLNGRPVISMHTGQIRGSVAHAIILADQSRMDRIAAIAPVPAYRVAPAEGRAFVASFGACLAAVAPNLSLGLIKTERSSASEREAMLKMGEQMKACMPEGFAYPLNISDLRNHIADALYRMSEKNNA